MSSPFVGVCRNVTVRFGRGRYGPVGAGDFELVIDVGVAGDFAGDFASSVSRSAWFSTGPRSVTLPSGSDHLGVAGVDRQVFLVSRICWRILAVVLTSAWFSFWSIGVLVAPLASRSLIPELSGAGRVGSAGGTGSVGVTGSAGVRVGFVLLVASFVAA